VRATIGLKVKANDLDRPDLLDTLGEQVDLCPDDPVPYRLANAGSRTTAVCYVRGVTSGNPARVAVCALGISQRVHDGIDVLLARY
jgi:hypothetical protein